VENKKLLFGSIAIASLQAFVTWCLNEFLSLSISLALVAAALPISILVFFVFRTKKQKPTTGAPKVPKSGVLKLADHLEKEEALSHAFNEVGLESITLTLNDSPFTPASIMKSSSKFLSFMGVLGSKWVNDPAIRSDFENYLLRIQSKQGKVRFCLINPLGDGYEQLKGFRDGKISHESLHHFKSLSEKYTSLEVRLYQALPSFRLILADHRSCVVARYKIDKAGYFQSKYGWEAPHMKFNSDANWSLYDPFERYFEFVWEHSMSLEECDFA